MDTRTITPDGSYHRIHTYFKGPPYHPDGWRVLYTRFKSLRDTAAVCLMDRETGEETVLGESDSCTYHNGASAWFCDGGDKVNPVFSHDSRRILYNSCTDGRVRLREIEL